MASDPATSCTQSASLSRARMMSRPTYQRLNLHHQPKDAARYMAVAAREIAPPPPPASERPPGISMSDMSMDEFMDIEDQPTRPTVPLWNRCIPSGSDPRRSSLDRLNPGELELRLDFIGLLENIAADHPAFDHHKHRCPGLSGSGRAVGKDRRELGAASSGLPKLAPLRRAESENGEATAFQGGEVEIGHGGRAQVW